MTFQNIHANTGDPKYGPIIKDRNFKLQYDLTQSDIAEKFLQRFEVINS